MRAMWIYPDGHTEDIGPQEAAGSDQPTPETPGDRPILTLREMQVMQVCGHFEREWYLFANGVIIAKVGDYSTFMRGWMGCQMGKITVEPFEA